MKNLLKLFIISFLITTSCLAAEVSWTEFYVDNTLASETKPEGTATGGGNDYICLEAGSDATNDQYNNYGIMIVGGTGALQTSSRRIIDYIGTGGTCELYAQVNAAWGTNPDATSEYEITLGADPNDGTTKGKSSDGTDGAWRTVQKAADTANDGHRANIKAGREYDLLARVDFNLQDGSLVNPIKMQGYTTNAGDGGIAIIDAQSSVSDVFYFDNTDQYIQQDLHLKGSTTEAWFATSSTTQNVLLFHLIVSGGTAGIDANLSGTDIIDCNVTSGTSVGIFDARRVIYNYVHDTGGDGIRTTGQITAYNIVDTSGDDSIESENSANLIFNNTTYNATDDNLETAGGNDGGMVFNNIFHTAGAYNIDTTSSTLWLLGYNNYYASTTAAENNITTAIDLSNNETGDPDLVDPNNGTPANNDFNLGSSTTIDDEGFPLNFYGITNTLGHQEMGATPYEEGAAVITRRIWMVMKNNNRINRIRQEALERGVDMNTIIKEDMNRTRLKI